MPDGGNRTSLVPLPARLRAENCREGRHEPEWQFKTTCIVCGAKREQHYESLGVGNAYRIVYSEWAGGRYV